MLSAQAGTCDKRTSEYKGGSGRAEGWRRRRERKRQIEASKRPLPLWTGHKTRRRVQRGQALEAMKALIAHQPISHCKSQNEVENHLSQRLS